MPDKLNFIIAAADDGNKKETKCKVSGVAYTGGKMRVGWGMEVVVALDGINLGGDNIPLLMNHDNSTGSRLGTLSAKILDGALVIEGEIIAETDEAKNVIDQMKAGADWQMSIGADVDECVMVAENEKMIVNGQTFEGPFHLIQKSTLREVSVVAVGADAETNMTIAAKLNLKQGDVKMAAENKPVVTPENGAPAQPTPVVAKAEPTITPEAVSAAAESAVKAERERVAAIQQICNGEFPEIEKEAISAGLNLDAVREKVLVAYREKQPKSAPNVIVNNTQTDAKVLEAALSLRAGIGEDAVLKSYGEQTIEATSKMRDISLRELSVECCRIEGKNVGRSFDDESIRAAFSTVSLPGILSNTANKKLLQAFTAQPIIATRLCSTGDLNDFKETDRFRMTDAGDLLQVGPDGEIKDGGFLEEKAGNKLETYAKAFCLTRQMIINDDLGAFMTIPTAWGTRAARLIDQLFFKRLLANPTQGDGNALFSAAHANLLTGATSALSADALQSALKLFMDQTDADGQPISIEAKYLLVPTALKFKALELTRGTTFIAAGSTDVLRPALNVLSDEKLEVVSSPYLSNSADSGHSDTAWYLFGAPSQTDTFEIGYLRGRRTPTIEKGDTNFTTLGMWWRVFFDVGVREQGHRGMSKANGAA